MSARAQPFTMRLMANGEEKTILDPDTPLILTVSIVDYEAIEAKSAGKTRGQMSQRLGSKSAPWTGMIRFLRHDGRKQALRWRLTLLANPKPDAIAVLDAFTSAFADFGVDAENVATIPPGRYTIRTSITGRASGRHYEVESNDIMVEVRKKRGLKTDENDEKQLNSASYSYRRAQYEKALSEVEAVLARDPEDITALILLGDIQFARRKYAEALSAYQEALSQYNAQVAIEEEPRALLAKIDATERKLNRRRVKEPASR